MSKRILSLALALLLLVLPTVSLAEARSAEGASTKELYVSPTPVTFKAMIPHDYLTDPSKEDPFIVWMSEKTNVNFTFEVISSADKSTKINLMLAGEEYPDFISGALLSAKQIAEYGEAGVLVALDEYLNDEYMPNFMRGVRDLYPNLLSLLTTEDGHIYSLPNAEVNLYDTYDGVFVNKEWLEKLNLTAPTTLDEFTNMLIAFKENDMNGNGDTTDEIPLAFMSSGAGRQGIAGWFGVSGYNGYMIYADDQAIFTASTEAWREYVKYMNKLWNLGLIDVEAFTQDKSTFNAKGQQATTIYGALVDQAPAYFTTADKYDDYELILPIKTDCERSGALRDRVQNMYVSVANTAVFNTCKDVPTLLKWLDNLYDPYYGQIASKGFLNGNLVENADGLIEFCADDAVPSQYSNQTDWMIKTHFQQWPHFRNRYYNEYFTKTGVVSQLIHLSQTYEPYYINEVMPSGFTYSAEQKVYDDYKNDIQKLVAERFAAWVTGERDVDADWDEYLSTLDNMRLTELVATYQAQYNRLKGK